MSAEKPMGEQSESRVRCTGGKAVIQEDQCIPTKERIEARRPDLAIRLLDPKKIIILEVACAWEPIVTEREAKKKVKYRELAAELANQWPGYTVQNAAVGIGTLGLVVGAVW